MHLSRILKGPLLLSFACLFMQIPSALAETNTESVTLLDIRKWSINNPVEHVTVKGTIICSDPQIPFDEKEWLANDGRADGALREHMLVDMILGKKMLDKSKASLDKLFKAPHSVSGENASYAFWSVEGRKCGNMPFLTLEVEFNKALKVKRYRSVYWEDFHTVASDWIE